jgi:hypothetical protein
MMRRDCCKLAEVGGRADNVAELSARKVHARSRRSEGGLPQGRYLRDRAGRLGMRAGRHGPSLSARSDARLPVPVMPSMLVPLAPHAQRIGRVFAAVRPGLA